jgi:hypothetical protein
MCQWYFFTLSFIAHPGPQTVALKVKEVPLQHYTLGVLILG